MTTPNRHIPYIPEGVLDPAAAINLALNFIDALLQTAVLSMALTAPPGGEADGDLYIPASPATGAWAGLEGYLVRYVAESDTWQSFEPGTEVNLVLNQADGGFYRYNTVDSPAAWEIVSGGGGAATVVDLGMFFPGNPGSSQLLFKFVAIRDFTFPADFAGARGHIGTNPTASFVMDVAVAGANIGTITVSTGGVFTFATTGGVAIPVVVGEEIEISGPAGADGTAADIAATLTADLDV